MAENIVIHVAGGMPKSGAQTYPYHSPQSARSTFPLYELTYKLHLIPRPGCCQITLLWAQAT